MIKETAVSPANETLKEKEKMFFLSDEEKKHDNFIWNRMKAARDERDRPRDEFDGMGYLEAYDRDTKSGTAFIASAQNIGESEVSTGTTRQALIALVARATSYNMTTEFYPFGKNNETLRPLATALEVSVAHANYLQDYGEKMKEIANELFTHGDVVVFSDWVKRHGWKKSRPDFDGKVTGVHWTKRKDVIFEGVETRVVPGRRFYFGDIFTTDMNHQPFNFEVNHIPASEAESKYGTWERFEFVPKGMGQAGTEFAGSAYAEDYKMESSQGDDIEEILYVDVPNNEMQIYLNRIPMLPSGFPMKWDHGMYPWSHQGAEPIRTGFVYHRSFVRTLLNMQDIENDLWRVLIMLAWKAALPPMANNTGHVVTRRNLMAGEINDGISAEMLKPILDGSLANTGFVESIVNRVNQNMLGRSVPEIKQGMGAANLNTAQEVVQIQKEAEIAISLNLGAISGIIAKTDRISAGNIIQFAFSKDGYSASADLPYKGGIARYVVEAVETYSTPQELRNRQMEMSKIERKEVRIVQVKKDSDKFISRLEAIAVAKPKRSSALDKQELQQMFMVASNLFGDRLDPTDLQAMFRTAYRLPDNFKLVADALPPMAEVKGQAPRAKLPPPAVGSALVNETPA